jgi:hypothetical protein
MKEEEVHELHILSMSREYLEKILSEQISALTLKALEVKLDDRDRLIALSGRKELLNFKSILGERQRFLIDKQKKETKGEEKDGNRT